MIGEILCEEQTDEGDAEIFADILPVLGSSKSKVLIRGICLTLNRFIQNEKICLKLIKLFKIKLSDEESK